MFSIVHLGPVPFLATRVEGETAWVSLIYVPRGLRRHGSGRQMFERWAASIPREVKQIKLLAAEIDDVSPIDFWEHLGFHADPYEPDLCEPTCAYMTLSTSLL
jgi:GNAT superfamily N-acetyltransferase